MLLLDQAGMLLLDQAGKTGLGQTAPTLGTTGKPARGGWAVAVGRLAVSRESLEMLDLTPPPGTPKIAAPRCGGKIC